MKDTLWSAVDAGKSRGVDIMGEETEEDLDDIENQDCETRFLYASCMSATAATQARKTNLVRVIEMCC